MQKEFTLKGKTKQELEKMDMKELLELLPARHRRSLRKGYSEEQKALLKKVKAAKEGKYKKKIKTHLRGMPVVPQMFDVTIFVHKGKEFLPVMITPDMLGHYLGEFVGTRKKVEHSAPGIGATRSSAAAGSKAK